MVAQLYDTRESYSYTSYRYDRTLVCEYANRPSHINDIYDGSVYQGLSGEGQSLQNSSNSSSFHILLIQMGCLFSLHLILSILEDLVYVRYNALLNCCFFTQILLSLLKD